LKGGTRQFSAEVEETNGPPQTLRWSVEGNSDSGTVITANGLLTVAAGETATALTVRATSEYDTSKSGTAAVMIPAVTGVTVSPSTVDVLPGGTQSFSAVVEGISGPPQTLTWSVEGNSDSGTIITANGLLTVAAGESFGPLTVRAISAYDPGTSGTAVVTVKPVVSIGGQGYASLEAAVSVAAGTTAIITVAGDISAASMTVSVPNTHITLKGETAERIITGPGATLFTLNGSPSSLTLDDKITLNAGGVTVNTGATLVLKTGAKITGSSARGVDVGNGGSFTMQGGSIQGNTASFGGGVLVASNGTFTMQNGSIQGNFATEGGGVYVYGGSFTMQSGSVEGNTASGTSAYGGGVCVISGTFTMSGGSVEGNSAADGGGVYVYPGKTFTMTGGSVKDNIASGTYSGGGGVYNKGTFNLTDGSIEGNTASGTYGGGGGVYSAGTFTMSGGSIEGNTASAGGGGVAVSSGTFTMQGGSVKDNTASAGGGGVAVSSNSTFTLSGGSVEGNTASGTYAYGGGVYAGSTTALTKTGGTIYGNETSTPDAQRNTVTNSSGSTVYTDRGAAVYVAVSSSSTALARLEKTVDAAHNLIKTGDDDTPAELSPENGWIDD
jgi:hypothetical protein